MLKKLRNRLLVVNLIGLTIVIAAAFSVIYLFAYTRAQAQIATQVHAIPAGVQENMVMSQRGAGLGVGLDDSQNTSIVLNTKHGDFVISGNPVIPVDYSKSFVANVFADGQVTVFSQIDLGEEQYQQAVEAALSSPDMEGTVWLDGREWMYSLAGSGGFGADAYEESIVFLDVDDTNRQLRLLALSLVLVGVCAIGAVFFVSYQVSNRAIAPVEAGMERQRRFVADASHELKTPLAVIAMNAEAARYSDDPAEWLGNIEAETGRMGRLIENLMNLARSEEARVERAAFDLAAAVEEEAGRIEAPLFERGVALSIEKDAAHLGVRTDQGEFMQALTVLLDNAVKYTHEGGKVTVHVGAASCRPPNAALPVAAHGETNRAYVSVANTGDFIAPPDMERIFDRFYRADKSRNSGTGGHGIGLSIAKTVMERLGGELTCQSDPQPDGSALNTFTLTIPTA
ncbi:MAG: HAMP domain-containing histidine kinase [Clostridiales Family XIII bacterium]|nr:HAMP domain-containing histidine kinase [Clostridiales Family XIII bacterium]